MKRLLTFATTLTTLRKMAFTLLCCTVLMVFAAPAQTPPILVGARIPIASGSFYGMYPNGIVSAAAGFTLSGSAQVTTIDVVLLGNGIYDFSLQNSLTAPVTTYASATLTAPTAGVPNTETMAVNATLPAGTYYIVGTGDPASTLALPGWYISDGTTFITNAGSVTNGEWASSNGGPWNFVTGFNDPFYDWAPMFTVYGSLLSETQTLEPGVQSVYTFLTDKYKITPSASSQGGESLTITAVPILKSSFVPPANFPNETCVPFADFSAANGADTCVGFQADCSYNGFPGGGDCNTLLYTLLESYDLPADLPAIGGPDFLVVHGSGCPVTPSGAAAQSIFTDYYVTRIDPTTKGGSKGTGSCFEVMYTRGAPLIATGTVSSSQFVGWGTPVVNGLLNLVKAGSTRPLIFNWNDGSGNPVLDLNYCPNMSGTGCATPWVNLSSFGIVCANGTPVNTATDTPSTSSAGNSGFQSNGGGNYQLNWQTQKSWKGYCANVQATFDNGLVMVPASIGFQFN